jgi:hypothetical protein
MPCRWRTANRARAATPAVQCAATFSATAPAKHTTAATRSAHPARSLGRPVTIPTIAADMHPTEMSASSSAKVRSTVSFSHGARIPSSRR